MKRHLMTALDAWKNSKRRKPLILNGARQVGKTWLLKEFGTTRYDNVAYANFDGSVALAASFAADFDMRRILTNLQAATGEKIAEGSTLLILDEIQECPRALTSLKYFQEQAPNIHVAAAGSLLGLTVHEGTGFPVGKVNMLDLHPLDFREFLDATGNTMLRELVDEGDPTSINAFGPKLTELLKQYYFAGGMPEAVAAFIDDGALESARNVQEEILRSYRLDASKHLSARETEHVLAVWDSLPAHLSRENKKFVFGQIHDGARARDYRSAITWLVQAGLATRVDRVSKPGVPLSSYASDNAFKLFCLDIGLLGALSGLNQQAIAEGNAAFTEFKGALTEQYVCQQLVASCGLEPFYWSADNSRGEIDFLAQKAGKTYAIEVKAEENLRAKSLRAFKERYPDVQALRFSLSGYQQQDWMANVPLYAMFSEKLWG